MTVQKIKSGRVRGIDADTFVGDLGQLFYNEDLGDLRLSDGVTPGGTPLSTGGGSGYVLPTATTTRLGGVKVDGTTITISAGKISANLTGYATQSFVTSQGYLTAVNWAQINNKPTLFSGNYNDLTNKPTIPTVPTVVSAFTNDSGYITANPSTSIVPTANNTYDLGSSTNQWRHLYVSGGSIYINNVKLSINANNQLSVQHIDLTTGELLADTAINAVTIDDNEPTTHDGALWWNTVSRSLLIKYEGQFVPATPTPANLTDLLDVTIHSDALADQQILSYSIKDNQWVNRTLVIPTPPPAYTAGELPTDQASLWYNTEDRRTYLYDGNQWVDASPQIPQDTFSGDYNDLDNKPTLFSGSYNDLTDKPSLTESSLVNGSYSLRLLSTGVVTLPAGKTVTWGQGALGAPQPYGGTDRIRLWDFNGLNTPGDFYNYAIGVEGDHVWFATDIATDEGGFKFYSRGQQKFKIGNAGSLMWNHMKISYNDAGASSSLVITDGNDYTFTFEKGEFKLSENADIHFFDGSLQTTAPLYIGEDTPTGYSFWYNTTDARTYVNNNGLWIDASPQVPQDTGFSGSYTDLTDKPVLFSGSYTDLTNKPTIPTHLSDLLDVSLRSPARDDVLFYDERSNTWHNRQLPPVPAPPPVFNVDTEPFYTGSLWYNTEDRRVYLYDGSVWIDASPQVPQDAGFSGDYNDLENKPVLFSGSYNDLTDKPTGLTFSGSYLDLTHKPTLFSGNYNDLTNLPTLFTSNQSLNSTDTPTFSGMNIANIIAFSTSGGLNAPTGGSQSSGTRIVFWPESNVSGRADYAMGMDSYTLWTSIPTSGVSGHPYFFKWYAGTNPIMSLQGDGSLTVSNNLEVDGKLEFKAVSDSLPGGGDNTDPMYIVKNDVDYNLSILEMYIGDDGSGHPLTQPSTGSTDYFSIKSTNAGIHHLFGSDGNYSLAGKIKFYDGTEYGGNNIIAYGGDFNIQSIGSTTIYTHASAGAKSFVFNADGTFTFPDGSTQSTAYSRVSQGNGPSNVQLDGFQFNINGSGNPCIGATGASLEGDFSWTWTRNSGGTWTQTVGAVTGHLWTTIASESFGPTLTNAGEKVVGHLWNHGNGKCYEITWIMGSATGYASITAIRIV